MFKFAIQYYYLQYNIIDCIHHAVHYICVTYL